MDIKIFMQEVLLGLAIAFMLFLIVVVIVSTVCLLAFDVHDKIMDKKRNKARDILIELLEEYCSNKNIPISYGDENYFVNNAPDAAGRITYVCHYTKDGIISYYDNFEIFIRNKREVYFSYTTLAHEIGHYISVNDFNDGSEEGADYEASKLVRSLLEEKLQKLFKSEFGIFFNEDELKNYVHKMVK